MTSPSERHHDQRMGEQPPDVGLVDVVEDPHDAVVLLDDEVEEGVEGVAAALLGDLGDGAAAEARAGAACRITMRSKRPCRTRPV